MNVAKMTWLSLAALAVSQSVTFAEEPNPRLAPLYRKVAQVASRYAPESTSHQFQDHIHCEHRTRLYVVPAIVKLPLGNQPPLEEVRGPMEGGLWCRIELRPGETPYARSEGKVSRGKFDEYIWYPYSSRLDSHLYVTLRLPPGGDERTADFLRDFEALLSSFDKLMPTRP